MARQHCPPVLLPAGGGSATALERLDLGGGAGAVSEADIQALIHAFPAALPIHEIDPAFAGAVPVCRELQTPAGAIDNLLVTPSGMPVLVECKLWRNPEGRREVVGQILDYAKELSRWSSADLQRAVNARLGTTGNAILELVRAGMPDVDESDFNDALTVNLRRGRFLLLIVGDGIREGVEAIAEYLQRHAGLHFSLGLVELPVYRLPDGGRLVAPRVLAHTTVITREVVAVPDGFAVRAEEDGPEDAAEGPGRVAEEVYQRNVAWWTAFLAGLTLDDPEQSRPKPSRLGFLAFSLPAPGGACWITVYRETKKSEVGLYLSSSSKGVGAHALGVVAEDWDAVRSELGGAVQLERFADGRPKIVDRLPVAGLDQPEGRAQAFGWLAGRLNSFVNVLRPRVRSAVADYAPGL